MRADAPLASNSARRDFACCPSRWHAPTKRAGRTAPGTPRGRRARPSVMTFPRQVPGIPLRSDDPRAPHRRGVRRGRRGPAALRPLPAARRRRARPRRWSSSTAAAGCAATRARRPATRSTSPGAASRPSRSRTASPRRTAFRRPSTTCATGCAGCARTPRELGHRSRAPRAPRRCRPVRTWPCSPISRATWRRSRRICPAELARRVRRRCGRDRALRSVRPRPAPLATWSIAL